MPQLRSSLLVRLAAAALLVPLAGFTQCGPDEVPIGSGDAGTGSDGGGSRACVTDADCASGETCGYAVAEACMATGVCMHNPATDPGPHPAIARIECACDGTPLSFAGDYPSGYAPRPVEAPGTADPTHECAPLGGGSDGGTISHDGGDSTPPSCIADADCATGQTCGYPVADACMAHGSCIYNPAADPTIAHCASVGQACGCDGTTVTVACDYPHGFAPKPVQPDPTACSH